MRSEKPKNYLLALGVIIASLAAISTPMSLFSSNSDLDDANSVVVEKKTGLVQANSPIMIWYQDPWRDPNIVKLVLENGIFNHVMLVGLHKLDNPSYYKKEFVKETIRLCKKKGAKVIWTRWLYPGYKFENFRNEDAFDPMYYVMLIQDLKREARILGADLIAFDAEPNAKATMKKLKNRKLTKGEFERMCNAIKKAVEIEGAVDFILPAGKNYRNHIYNATRLLGKNVISEFTYYDRSISSEYSKIPYDIYGAFVNTTKRNMKNANLPFFMPKEILEKQYLWGDKKGIFVYPGTRKQAALIAIEFSKIKSINPVEK